MYQYLLSLQAQQSLIQIGQYTLENFGPQQKKRYLKMLRDRMRAAAKYPEMGRERSEIKGGYYSVQAEKHHIYNRSRDTHIEIIDVSHQSMEPKIHIG